MGQMTLILGGARSGKSTFALRLAERHGGQVTFIATAATHDDEMKARIADHRRERPSAWETCEIPYGIAAELERTPLQTDVVVLDCITLLVSNLLLRDEPSAPAQVEAEVAALLTAIKNGPSAWIIVSNEVGLGLVPEYPLGRIYRDLLGRANQQLAAQADKVFWMVAGIPVPVGEYRQQP